MNEAFRLSADAGRVGPRVEMVQPDAWAAIGNASRAVSGGQDRDEKITPKQKIERLRESRDESCTRRTSTGATAACDNPPRDESRHQ